MTAPTINIPDNPDDFADSLSSPEKLKKVTDAYGTGPNGLKQYAKDYTNKLNEKNASAFKEQIEEQAKIALSNLLVANHADSPVAGKKITHDTGGRKPFGTFRNVHEHSKTADGAGLDGMFNSFAHYLQFIWNATHPAGNRQTKGFQENLTKVVNYQEKVPGEGGFLVPEEFRSGLMSLSLGMSIMRPRATVIPMNSLTMRIPTVDETSRVSSVFGGVVVYRTEEGAELTESGASFASIKLEATKQTALAHVTNELVRDTNGFGAYIEQTIPPAMAFYEDLDFISGTGVGEPLGAVHPNNAALITVAKETTQPAATIVYQNVLKMYARFNGVHDRAIWIVTPDAFVELATMALDVGTGGSAVWLTDAVGKPRLHLLGIPVEMTEKAPAVLGTVGDISLIDPGYYLIGDRQRIEVDSSPHVKFTSDKTTFRAIARNDGRPWLLSPLTPANNGPTMSPFVNLATRA